MTPSAKVGPLRERYLPKETELMGKFTNYKPIFIHARITQLGELSMANFYLEELRCIRRASPKLVEKEKITKRFRGVSST